MRCCRGPAPKYAPKSLQYTEMELHKRSQCGIDSLSLSTAANSLQGSVCARPEQSAARQDRWCTPPLCREVRSRGWTLDARFDRATSRMTSAKAASTASWLWLGKAFRSTRNHSGPNQSTPANQTVVVAETIYVRLHEAQNVHVRRSEISGCLWICPACTATRFAQDEGQTVMVRRARGDC